MPHDTLTDRQTACRQKPKPRNGGRHIAVRTTLRDEGVAA